MTSFLISILMLFFVPSLVFAQDTNINVEQNSQNADTDKDGLSDFDEKNIYNTNIENPDTDSDGYLDGEEIKFSYDPNKDRDDKLSKSIVVVIADQSLSYRLGNYIVGAFKISTGLAKTPTPTGDYEIEIKKPLVNYIGTGYSYKNTKWNMLFKRGPKGNYYIHGAYWHNSFGEPMSHGCINVSYGNMEKLYNWTDVGTKVVIK